MNLKCEQKEAGKEEDQTERKKKRKITLFIVWEDWKRSKKVEEGWKRLNVNQW